LHLPFQKWRRYCNNEGHNRQPTGIIRWLTAGWAKVTSPTWLGSQSGTALTGFVNGALQQTTGAHANVQSWYALFLQTIVLPAAPVWSWIVTFGELFVGVALILGIITGLAAFFGGLMNVSYLLAGSLSVNPFLFVFAPGLSWPGSQRVGLVWIVGSYQL
jgi:thiosulfate dehydrogenase (quinone) large subunit